MEESNAIVPHGGNNNNSNNVQNSSAVILATQAEQAVEAVSRAAEESRSERIFSDPNYLKFFMSNQTSENKAAGTLLRIQALDLQEEGLMKQLEAVRAERKRLGKKLASQLNVDNKIPTGLADLIKNKMGK